MRLFYLLLFIFVSVGCYGQEKGIVQEIVTINDTLYEVSHGELFVIDTKHVLIKPKASVKQLPENMKQVSKDEFQSDME